MRNKKNHRINIMAKKILPGFFLLICACQGQNNVPHTEEAYTIIPAPQQLMPGTGNFIFDASTHIQLSEDTESLRSLAQYFSTMFQKAAGFSLPIKEGDGQGKNVVFLNLDESSEGGEEAYTLDVTSQNIIVKANSSKGLFYGIQSIRQLLPAEIEGEEVLSDIRWMVPAVKIEDGPRFKYRGMQMDVSRHFFSTDYLKTFIDRLALFKFNRFHIHLTDDQGWRLQIDQYPQLTDQGAWRTMNNHDQVCIENAENNPDFELPKAFFKQKDGQEVYGGYYTQTEMKDIIRYAQERGITIVPEIDMPGHMGAAIQSFPELSCVDGGGWGDVFSVPLCPCEEGTYEFVENILAEVAALFPGEYIHIGADEVEKNTWETPGCRSFMKQNKLTDVEELQGYFVKKVEGILNKFGKKMIGWDEALEGGINPSTTIMYWRGWVPEAPIEAAKNGHDVIMTPTSHCYFDYVPDDGSLMHVYNFDPIPKELKGEYEQNIIGVQANLWSEYIPTPERLEFMSTPRIMSLAEVAWTRNKNEGSFQRRVDQFYKRLNIMGVNYRLPDIPNLSRQVVFIDSAELKMTRPAVIDEIRYTTDGSIPDLSSILYEQPVVVTQNTGFKIATFVNGRRANVYNVNYEKQNYRASVNVQSEAGLEVSYYEAEHKSVGEVGQKGYKKTSIEAEVKFPGYARKDQFGCVFEGFIEVPDTAIYTFYLTSDDGSTMEIGDKLVVNNDGFHGMVEVEGQVALEAGKHPIRIKFFQGAGGYGLNFEYLHEGEKINPPADMFSH